MRLPAIAAGQPQVFSSKRGCDEADENGMRVFGSAFEFGMELNADEEGMAGNFDYLCKAACRIDSADSHSCLFQFIFISRIQLITVTMPF